MVRHISTKNQRLDFPDFHCSIVCSYCSICWLIIKSGSKMVQISNASYENEIHRVDSPFNESSKNIILLARETLISEERRPENLGKMAKNRKAIVMQIRKWSILIGNTGLYSLVSKSLHCLGFPACWIKLFAKTEEVSFQSKFCPNFAALSSLKLGTFLKF